MFLCGSFLLFAFYLQHYQYIPPCPLCILQRYAYSVIFILCLIGRVTSFVRTAAFLSLVSAVLGAVAAAMQMWTMKTSSRSCGRDPLEAFLNGLFPAKWLPSVFEAEGFCNAPLDRILGLTLPEWSLAWFMLFAFVFFIIMLRGRK